MGLSFDHIVHLVNDPVKAAADLRELGLHALEGGRHANWGTYNSLCYFDLSYVEFLGVYDRPLAESVTDNQLVRESAERLPSQEGFIRVALRTNDIEQTASSLRANGLRVIGPFPGSRTRPDGTVINWSMLFIETDESSLLLPFVIQWGQSDDERRKDLQERGVIAPHKLGSLSLRQVAFAVRDLDINIEKWSRWFGLEAGDAYYDSEWNAVCRLLHLPGGNLLFCRPDGEGLVSAVLQTKGETPFALLTEGALQKKVVEIFGSNYHFV